MSDLPDDASLGDLAGTPPAAWQVVGAAVQGSAHARLGLPCQDAQDYRLLPGGILLIALADGAGSAACSDQGAGRAVSAALEALADALVGDEESGTGESNVPPGPDESEALLQLAFEAARQALEALSEQEEAGLRDFATTLSLVIAGPNWLAVGQLGDGAVIVQGTDGELFAAAGLQRGEYANETFFLTQEDALERVELLVLDQAPAALAVMSDGLTRLALKLPAQEPHPPFFQPLFAFAAAAGDPQQSAGQLAAFLASERICARTDDDKALVLAVRGPVENGPQEL